MANTKLGEKHDCHECGAKFYDLGKDPVICPKCGTDQGNPEAETEPEEVAAVEEEDLPAEQSPDEDDDLDDDDLDDDLDEDLDDDDLDEDLDDDDLDEDLDDEDDDD